MVAFVVHHSCSTSVDKFGVSVKAVMASGDSGTLTDWTC